MLHPGDFHFFGVTNFIQLECFLRAASRTITGCLLFSPISPLLSEAYLPPLRANLIHFALSFFLWALHLPFSCPVSVLARLGVKPKLFNSSWRAFPFTHPLMLYPTSPREVIFACPLLPSCNLPSFTVESTISSSCFRSDPLLSRQGAALAYLDSLLPHDLVILTDSSVSFSKGGSGALANCSLGGTKATLSFSAGPVCSRLSAKTCTILQALCWFRQHQQVCHFSSLLFLSDCRSVLFSVFLLTSTL